jgi:thiol-disulfide isomerase/thioredoxin
VIKLRLIAALLLAGLPVGMLPSTGYAAETAAPARAAYYPEDADAAKVLDAALVSAKAEGKLAVIVFGADWCHDSQGLAKVLTSDAFKTEFGARFTVTFIDVGTPQAGKGRNLDLRTALRDQADGRHPGNGGHFAKGQTAQQQGRRGQLAQCR